MTLHCIFCGRQLTAGARRGLWVCRGCHARFRVDRNRQGCVIRLRVSECGTSHCCQFHRC